jgi:flavin-dependent dehydrogenase
MVVHSSNARGSKMADLYDVIVIGGGPGGAAAAIACAQANLQVLLLEKQPFPREHPGETLHPGIEPLLKQLGVFEPVVSAGFLRHRGTWVQWEDGLQFMPFGEDESGIWQGFQALRADFDAILLERAKALGVEVRQPCRVSRAIAHQGRVLGVETSQGSIKGSRVIDAAGSHHWLAKQMGLAIQTYSPPLMAHYGYAQGNCPLRDKAPAIVADARGWTWTAKVSPERYQWTRLTLYPEPRPRDWLPPEFSELKPMGKSQVADVTWRKVDCAAGPGYFLIGDAASVVDPASSHGVLKAIMSGMMAGHLTQLMFEDPHREYEAVQEYCRWTRTWFFNDIEKLKQLYRRWEPPNSRNA